MDLGDEGIHHANTPQESKLTGVIEGESEGNVYFPAPGTGCGEDAFAAVADTVADTVADMVEAVVEDKERVFLVL